MSPFSQLGNIPGMGYGGGIDRDFSPILNYLDEFDRHFSRRHRFVNCFIPRFDLEEDAHNYYLYGDIPGATIDTINIEAHNNHTLSISGKTARTGPTALIPIQNKNTNTDIKIPIEDLEHKQPPPAGPPPEQQRQQSQSQQEKYDEIREAPTDMPYYPPPPTQSSPQPQAQHHHVPGNGVTLPHHERHHTANPTSFFANPYDSSPSFSNNNPTSQPPTNPNDSSHRILLSERLVGDFHRTFAFPSPVVEEGVKASLENGVLSLVVPKREGGGEEKRGKRIPVMLGNWWKGEYGGRSSRDEGRGFGFASGAV